MTAKDLIDLLTYLTDHPLALVVFMVSLYMICTIRLFDLHFYKNGTVIHEAEAQTNNKE